MNPDLNRENGSDLRITNLYEYTNYELLLSMKQFTIIFIFLTLNFELQTSNCIAQQIDTAQIYKSKCAGCHGIEGDGQGPGASIVFPPPRNFQTWMFKYKSTPVDYPPADDDLISIIKTGLPGTSMPGFEEILTEEEIRSLAIYLERFSFFPIEKEDSLPVVEIVQPPREPDVEHGKELYKMFDCAKCHGAQGRGDGPSYPDLTDDWENQIFPRNFTKGWIYRRGSTAEDIYIALKIGTFFESDNVY